MKKASLVIFFIFLTISSFTQEKINSYYSSSLKIEFNIRAVIDNNDNPILYLEVFNGILRDLYYFKIDNVSLFINALSEAKSTFTNWKKLAKDNKVITTVKGMSITFPRIPVYHYDSFDKKFIFLEELEIRPIFTVSNYVSNFQLSGLSKIVKDQAFSVVLSNEKDFEKLISKISADKLKSDLTKLKRKKKD